MDFTDEDRVLRAKVLKDLMFFSRYIYKSVHKKKFRQAKHLHIIADMLMRVIKGEITRLIINIPPRYGKTELAVKMFIAYGLAINPRSKYIHLSYSNELALDNSTNAKEYVEHEAFQKFFPLKLKKDSKSKKKWYTLEGGGVYATASGGAITGFGAGETNSNEFSGAIIIDDPLKPDDASSDVMRKRVNDRYENTIRSRVNDRNTPIIVIMQRLHENDMSGYLLGDENDEDWTLLSLPALDENNVPLYPEKHTFEELESMRRSNPYVFAGQYMQLPAPLEGGVWKKEDFTIIPKAGLPTGIKWNLYVDGAYTKETKNDPTGLLIAGRKDKDLYILHAQDQRLELPALIKYIPLYIKAIGVDIGRVRIEPKASGKSIKQVLREHSTLNVMEIKSDMVQMSKIERANTGAPFIEGGRVILVSGSWNTRYLDQVTMFPNAKHDEFVDLTSYAIDEELINTKGTYDIR